MGVMDDRLRAELDTTRQRLQAAADQAKTFRTHIQGKLRGRRWLRPAQIRLRHLKPKRSPVGSRVIGWIRRIRRKPAPPACPQADWLEKLDEILKVIPDDPAH